MKFLLSAIIICFFLSWGIGGGTTGFSELLQLFCGKDISSAAAAVLLELRLPRIIGALVIGAMLSGAGCASQNLFRN
ncbi:MAG: iron chelate uptake ABC transporter family permease subunit, partial [Lentisphaeria bacterium]|nr:iron chelate uptake ABC transporter family permease subunit [Lentisphaeria bacterium]